MTNLPLENLEIFPNRLVRSKIHQEVDAAKFLLQSPRTKAMGAEETQEYTYSKDAQDNLLAPMGALQAKRADEYQRLKKQLQEQQRSQEETLKSSKARESGLKKQLQEQLAEKSLLQETLKRSEARESDLNKQLQRSEARESDLKKQLQEQKWQVVQAQAEKQKERPFQAQALVQQSQMPSTTDDKYLRRLSALQKLHTSYLGEVPAGTAGTPPWPPRRFFELAMEAENNWRACTPLPPQWGAYIRPH